MLALKAFWMGRGLRPLKLSRLVDLSSWFLKHDDAIDPMFALPLVLPRSGARQPRQDIDPLVIRYSPGDRGSGLCSAWQVHWGATVQGGNSKFEISKHNYEDFMYKRKNARCTSLPCELFWWCLNMKKIMRRYRRLRARMALTLFNDVPLRTRKALSP